MFSSFSLISLYKRFGSLLCSIFFVLWLCKKIKRECCLNSMVIKPLGKNVGGFLLQICDLTSLDDRGHFLWGVYEQLEKFWRYSQKCTFKSFVAFLRKDGTKMKRKPEGGKKTLTINSRVFLAIKPLTQP